MRCLLVLVALLGGCAAVPVSSGAGRTLPPGEWGGDQVGLEVSADGAGRVTLSCASAAFPGPVKLHIGGHFLAQGSFTPGGGPEPMGGRPSVPANISGRLDPGGTLWLDIATRDSYPVRSARLQRGVPPRLFRCL